MYICNEIGASKKRHNLDREVARKGTFSVKWAEASGKNIFPMHLADMEFLTEEKISKALRKRAGHGIYGYTFYPETMLDAAVSWFGRRHGWEINRENVSICHGVLASINIAVRAFSKPGDKVIIQPPVYQPFSRIISANGRTVLENRLIYNNNRYEINFDELSALAKKASLLILCNPHNPVGRVWNRDELNRLGSICAKNRVRIISDDIHCDFSYGARYTPVASINKSFAGISATCYSPSKTFNMAGLNASITVIPDKSMFRKFEEERVRSGFGRINIFGMLAMEAAYRHGGQWLENVLSYIKGNLNSAAKMIAGSKNIGLAAPEGTYLAWLDFRKCGLKESEIQKRLQEQVKIILEPGSVFGEAGRGFYRLNVSCSRPVLEKHMARMIAEFDTI